MKRTDLTENMSSLAKSLANLVSINIGTHGTGILKTWKITLTLLMSSFSDCSLPTISSAGPPKCAYMLNTYIYFFVFLFCYMLSQVFVYVCSNVWTWCIGNSQFFLFKAADTCICCCFGASAPGNLGWKHLYLLWGPRHLYLFRGPRYLNLGSHLTLQSLVPLVHLDVVQLELLLITDHLQRNSIII